MANTYSQLYIHVVFAVKNRSGLISKTWKEELNKYISGIIANRGQKLMIINGVADHIHILLGVKPDHNLSDLVRDIKSSSTKWINENRFALGKFEWQSGFGAFTVSPGSVSNVIQYISMQEEHHKTRKFKDEYIGFLTESGIDFKPEYIFTDVEER
jgi:REP element-mobilizing transposase RayT